MSLKAKKMNIAIDTRQVLPLIYRSYSRNISGDQKARVLNALLRRFPISKEIMTLKKLTKSQYNNLSIHTGISISVIKSIVNKFLIDLYRIKDFYNSCIMNWDTTRRRLCSRTRAP